MFPLSSVSDPGVDHPTWVIRLSVPDRRLDDVGYPDPMMTVMGFVGRYYDDGFDVSQGRGSWHGEVETSFTITVQTDEAGLTRVLAGLDRLADAQPRRLIRWLHVERHEPKTYYVDLERVSALRAKAYVTGSNL